MPVEACEKDGNPGYRYGKNGKCYTYKRGDLASEKAAHDQAVAQGRAIERSKGNW